MSTLGVGTRNAYRPRPLIPALDRFYDRTPELAYLLVRLTAGGMLLVHGIQKLTNLTVAQLAANSKARRGIEPAMGPPKVFFWTPSVLSDRATRRRSVLARSQNRLGVVADGSTDGAPQPHPVIVECGAAVGRDRVGAGERVDPAAILMGRVRPDRLGNQHSATHAVE